MVIPAGHIGPSHIHYDVEEVFFVMRGKMKVVCEKDGERWEAVLGERDLISVPPGVYREEHQHRRRRRADVRDAGFAQADHADLPARHPAGQDQAR